MDEQGFDFNYKSKTNKKSILTLKNNEFKISRSGEALENHLEAKSDLSDLSNNLSLQSTVKMELTGTKIRSDILLIGSNLTHIGEKSPSVKSKSLNIPVKVKHREAAKQISDMDMNISGAVIHADLLEIGSNCISLKNNEIDEKSFMDKRKRVGNIAGEDHNGLNGTDEDKSKSLENLPANVKHRDAAKQVSDIKMNLSGAVIHASILVIGSNSISLENNEIDKKSFMDIKKQIENIPVKDHDVTEEKSCTTKDFSKCYALICCLVMLLMFLFIVIIFLSKFNFLIVVFET